MEDALENGIPLEQRPDSTAQKQGRPKLPPWPEKQGDG